MRSTLRIELVDSDQPEVRALLRKHAREMAARYGSGGEWSGVQGRKDLVWIVRDGAGEAQGCVALRELAPGRVEVKHLYVRTQARRRGLASVLMDALEDEADRRRSEVVLETGTAQPEAVALYRRRGYIARGPYQGSEYCGERSLYFTRARRERAVATASRPRA